MSYAIYILAAEEFSEEKYGLFLNKAKHLYGEWNLLELVTFGSGRGNTLHQCEIQPDLSSPDWFRLHIRASRRDTTDPAWAVFDYLWYLQLETSVSRTAIALAVQLGAL